MLVCFLIFKMKPQDGRRRGQKTKGTSLSLHQGDRKELNNTHEKTGHTENLDSRISSAGVPKRSGRESGPSRGEGTYIVTKYLLK